MINYRKVKLQNLFRNVVEVMKVFRVIKNFKYIVYGLKF